MTIREVNDLLREDELIGESQPIDRFVGIMAILRTIEQGDIATNEGILASHDRFIESFGPITTETVDIFMLIPSCILDLDIPNNILLEILEAD